MRAWFEGRSGQLTQPHTHAVAVWHAHAVTVTEARAAIRSNKRRSRQVRLSSVVRQKAYAPAFGPATSATPLTHRIQASEGAT